ncbi:Cytoplasmic tRNA 2-thiolation protein 2 [Microsporum canis]
MDRYKDGPKDKQPTLLLPLSFGVSSLSLLHLLDDQLAHHRSNEYKRVPYKLHVLSVDSPTLDVPEESRTTRLEILRSNFPDHTFTEIPLHSIFRYDENVAEFMLQHYSNRDISDASITDENRLEAFRSSLSTPTSRADFDCVLLRKLVVAFANSEGCDGILWGDSDSRLAAKALAGVANGRGTGLPWEVCDGPTPWGVHFTFPVRDIFKSELVQYASVRFPDLISKIGSKEQKIFNDQATKNMSISDLMTQYVEQQGEKYPGVMANIVRTIDKLQPPKSHTGLSCVYCGVPLESAQMDPATLSILEERDLIVDKDVKATLTCYGCARTFLDFKQSATSK